MTAVGVRIPQLTPQTWILVAAITVAAWLLREHLQEILRDTIEGRADETVKYGILLTGGFLVGWMWAGQYPTTPGGLAEWVVSGMWEWATSLIPI